MGIHKKGQGIEKLNHDDTWEVKLTKYRMEDSSARATMLNDTWMMKLWWKLYTINGKGRSVIWGPQGVYVR